MSPSLLGAPEQPNSQAEVDEFVLPAAALPRPSGGSGRGGSGGSGGRSGGRISELPPVPAAPPSASSEPRAMLSSEASIAPDESYGADERALNDFVCLHPMMSLNATSYKTMQLIGSMFEKATVQVADVPVVPKSYDDGYLRPPNTQIGERECACGELCLCVQIAAHRHGKENDVGFVGTEFLLPTEREDFLAGRGLPKNRKKCLVCTRYFQNYLYWKARTDPNFKVEDTPIGMQAFGNVVAAPPDAPPDLAQLSASMHELPVNASPVSTNDGYKPEAMLFVDEEFAGSSRAAREGRMATLAWKPVVRFKTRHYRYVRSAEGSHLVQVGIGAADATGTGLGFAAPAAMEVAPLSA